MRDVVDIRAACRSPTDAAQAMRDSELSLRLRRHAVGGRTAARTSAAILRLAEQIGAALEAKRRIPHRVRRALDGACRARSRTCRTPDPRTAPPARIAASTSACASSRSSCAKARRSATTTSRRSPSSAAQSRSRRRRRARSCSAHLPCEFLVTNIARRRDAQDGLQRLPRAQDHVRQRDRPRRAQSLGVDAHEVMDLVCARQAASTSRPRISSRASPSAARACRRICAR